MTSKTIFVTGGSSGLGFECCRQLAALGHRIYFSGRDKERCENALTEIKRHSGNEQVDYFLADFSSQTQLRKLSAEIHSKIKTIDVFVNNAGGVFSKFTLSEDGYEKTFALNHLSYFLLTHLLLDLIPGGGRIINVASHSHYSGKIDFESFTKNKNYTILKAYCQSKLANVLFTHELSERLKKKEITVNALHPGRVRTRIGNKDQAWYLSVGWSVLTTVSSISPVESVKTFVYLATDDEVKNVTGKYFAKSKEEKSSRLSYDETLAKKLWEVSEKFAGITTFDSIHLQAI